ncbi:phosphate ABC transporter substrate-binding/OmpA family protein, partial [bacterium]|nr:phosphate ABC transporter substrate-binding/OmpA family protein [bacterium]
GACGDLHSDLIGSLAIAWSEGELSKGPDGNLYIQSTSKGKIMVLHFTAEDGFHKIAAGELDLFFADRAPTSAEVAKFGSDFKVTRAVAEVVALDALTLMVSPDSNLDVYRVGEPFPLQIAAGPEGSTIRRQAKRFNFPISGSMEAGGEQAALSDPSLLALGLYHKEGGNLRAKRLAVKSSPEATALKPSPFTISTEDYRYTYRVVAWNNPKPSPAALSFVKYATSNQGQAVVQKQGYIDLIPDAGAEDIDPEILAALGEALGVDKISSALRLSTNLRFAVGKSELDLKAQADLERIPRLVAGSYKEHTVVILGFTDSDGGPIINMPLSKDRAEVVAKELRRSKVNTRSSGLGQAFPVDTNETEAGKARNRRAEVWVVKP